MPKCEFFSQVFLKKGSVLFANPDKYAYCCTSKSCSLHEAFKDENQTVHGKLIYNQVTQSGNAGLYSSYCSKYDKKTHQKCPHHPENPANQVAATRQPMSNATPQQSLNLPVVGNLSFSVVQCPFCQTNVPDDNFCSRCGSRFR